MKSEISIHRDAVRDCAEQGIDMFDVDHEYIANCRIMEMVDVLKNFDSKSGVKDRSGNICIGGKDVSYSSEDFYNALAWAGLETTEGWKKLSDETKQLYNAINTQESGTTPHNTMLKIICLFLLLVIYNIDCQGRNVVVRFEQTIVDSVFLFEFNESWIFNSKGKVKNNIVTLKCTDSPSFYEIRYGNTRIGLYLFKDENKLEILNNKVVRSDSINYIINSQLNSLNDITLIQNVIKNCSDESLKIFLNIKLAASNNLIDNLYPCYYINYINKIPELTKSLELFFEKNFKLKNKDFIKQLSMCIHNKVALKLYYKFLIKDLFRESSSLKCEVIKLVLNEDRDIGFSSKDVNYMKIICP